MPKTLLSETASVIGGISLTAKMFAKDVADDPFGAITKLLNRAILNAALKVFVPELQRVLSIEGPPRSQPGEPPHKQPLEDHNFDTKHGYPQQLVDSVSAWEMAATADSPNGGVAIGSGNMYGLYLEIGTQDMAPRPWLIPTITRSDVVQAFESAVFEEMEELFKTVGLTGPAELPATA